TVLPIFVTGSPTESITIRGCAVYLVTCGGQPWCCVLLFFDDARSTFILSPASDFLISATTRASSQSQSQETASGIDSRITTLPEGFAHTTILVVEQGTKRSLETWGGALARLQGKAQVAKDAEPILAKVGYWTDNGATYYYKY